MHVVQPFTLAGGKTASITYGVELDGAASPDTVLDGLMDAFTQNWNAMMDGDILTRPPFGYFRAATAAPLTFHQSVRPQVQGIRVIASEVNSIALGVTKRTALVGKRGRGRCYIPGVLGEAEVLESGALTVPVVTDRQNRATAWRTAIEGLGGVDSMVLLTTYISQATPGGPILPDPEFSGTTITSLLVRGIVRTQRRRLVRGG